MDFRPTTSQYLDETYTLSLAVDVFFSTSLQYRLPTQYHVEPDNARRRESCASVGQYGESSHNFLTV